MAFGPLDIEPPEALWPEPKGQAASLARVRGHPLQGAGNHGQLSGAVGLVMVKSAVPVACPIGRSTPGTCGHSRTARYSGSRAAGAAAGAFFAGGILRIILIVLAVLLSAYTAMLYVVGLLHSILVAGPDRWLERRHLTAKSHTDEQLGDAPDPRG
jgi:hypothetical protein